MLDIFWMCAARKFINPNRRLIPALSVGEVISTMALTLDGYGLMPSGVTMVRRYLTLSTHGCRLNTMLQSFALSNPCVNMWSCSWLLLAVIMISSATMCTPGIPANSPSFFL